MQSVLRFNGGLFEQATALPLTDEQIGLLIDSGRKQWREVEPAIFGTLLERALDKNERHKLGAHFTPRAYVERLVLPTIVEPLREQWSNVQAAAVTLAKGGQLPEARKQVSDFLDVLCNTTVLDPACGTANFLYVAMEHMKRLEGEVRDMLRSLGETQTVFEGTGHSVDPHQFLGIEINPRAAAIAELVLWIGYLQWHFRTFGARMPAEPIIKPFHNIECRDAVLTYDRKEIILDKDLKPLTRWDGITFKQHPATGESIPDESARIPVYRYLNPRKAAWPKADFVIGNPPYLGARRIRLALGDEYVNTLRSVYSEVPDTCDLVMYWWNNAANSLRASTARRFGFITTNSIVQSYSRVLIEAHLSDSDGVKIVYAIPDHPWIDSSDGAAVRVAMTVCLPRCCAGGPVTLLRVVREEETEGEVVLEQVNTDVITAALSGTYSAEMITPLKANEGVCFQGVVPAGDGFKLRHEELQRFGFEPEALPSVIKKYIIGRDLVRTSQNKLIIDFYGLTETEARSQFPTLYQRVVDRVLPERKQNNRAAYRERWWLFAEPRPAMRKALSGLSRFIVTPYTAKHRPFIFVEEGTLPDAMAYAIASDDAYILGVLSSRPHVLWAVTSGGRLGVGNDPRYTSNTTFLPFAFPLCNPEQKERIRSIAESLDSHRKRQLDENASLTMTDMYNVLGKIRSGEALTKQEKVVHEIGLVSVLRQIHEELDSAVLDAYGWPPELGEDEILRRLVELNSARIEEEKTGVIRWLRPEYQNPEGTRAATASQGALPIEPESPQVSSAVAGSKRPWPKTLPEQAQAVRAMLAEQPTGLTPEQLARVFLRANTQRVADMLKTLVSLGQARTLEGDRYVRT
jgi:hypothetical protein